MRGAGLFLGAEGGREASSLREPLPRSPCGLRAVAWQPPGRGGELQRPRGRWARPVAGFTSPPFSPVGTAEGAQV